MRTNRLLDAKRVPFTIIDVSANRERRDEMIERAGGRSTVPQIFIDGDHIGGSDDLYALERRHRLDPMLRRWGAATLPVDLQPELPLGWFAGIISKWFGNRWCCFCVAGTDLRIWPETHVCLSAQARPGLQLRRWLL